MSQAIGMEDVLLLISATNSESAMRVGVYRSGSTDAIDGGRAPEIQKGNFQDKNLMQVLNPFAHGYL
ncbi:hypothetical protein TWF217_005370 [Orbilia oligospora]|nr:hypothetical protein TWF217_005370 [Orbilia oligospora]KAF3295460.1 hypothetical protein TWF132_001509 [Orbilia oligospora]